MDMKRLLIIFSLILAMAILLSACQQPEDNGDNGNDEKTFVIFDNTQGITAISVYSNGSRTDRITAVNANEFSQLIASRPGRVTFYFSYSVILTELTGFVKDYVSALGFDRVSPRIDENTTTNIPIPTLSETVMSLDALLFPDSSFLFIRNNSSISFQLLWGTSPVTPDNSTAFLVNAGENAQYTIRPGTIGAHRIFASVEEFSFPDALVLEAGYVYVFNFDGRTLSPSGRIRITAANVGT